MKKALRITLIVLGVLVVAVGLVFAGAWIGHRNLNGLGQPLSAYRLMGLGNHPVYGNGYGMMGGARHSGPGMMGGYGYNTSSATPLTIDQAYQTAGRYLDSLNNPDLKIIEVMVFDNNAYVRVVEKSTGIGAFELLVDPFSLAVTPEPGPDMMWNLKYSGLNHSNMMGGRAGMMGNGTFSTTPATVLATMPVSSAQALQSAQHYLDKTLPGTKTAADADPFYGYYTIDILRDGKITGMLSVNGYSGQVFLHTWHGTFIATQDY
jgi:hypothetical protein